MDDLIKRQDAIDAVNYHCESLKDIKRAIVALPSAQQWIPCSERLPELLEDVVMCDSFGDMAVGYYRQRKYLDGREYFEWRLYRDDEYDFEPIAWMPLPEPYKENTNE